MLIMSDFLGRAETNPGRSEARRAAMFVESSRFINEKKWVMGKFRWQEGYGAFSYSKSQTDRVARYVLNQKKHHEKRSFREEYTELLKRFEIAYDEKYLFDWIEDDD